MFSRRILDNGDSKGRVSGSYGPDPGCIRWSGSGVDAVN